MTTKTREQMIRELTEMELRFLLDNPDQIEQVAMFFTGNGYNKYSDLGVQKAWDMKMKEEVE